MTPADLVPADRDAAEVTAAEVTADAHRTGNLVAPFDVLLADLDGTVYRGGVAIDGAVDAIRACTALGVRSVYVTNNASRPPAVIAGQLTRAGLPTGADDVVTSAQAGARLLASLLGPGTDTLVVGSEHLTEEVAAVGLRPVSSRAPIDQVRAVGAVVQGFDPGLAWRDVAAAGYALATGAPWVATNDDLTIPTADGIAPGNGSLVAMVAAVVGRRPAVAGKPERPLVDQAIERTGARAPLVVGDRLDTDIQAGVRAGLPTLLVLTGVSGPADLVEASPAERPTHLAADLSGLLRPALVARRDDTGSWSCGGWSATARDGRLAVRRTPGPAGDHRDGGSTQPASGHPDDRVAGLWALAHLAWEVRDAGGPTSDPGVAAALDALGWTRTAS